MMEHQALQTSLTDLSKVIRNRLLSIPSASSSKEIRDITRFLKETQRLRETISSMMPAGDCNCGFDYEEGLTEDESDAQMSVIEILTQSCEIIANMYKVLDHKRMKEDHCEWVSDDASVFLTEMRQTLGGRIPAVPNLVEAEKGV
jgi:hypothetical protein